MYKDAKNKNNKILKIFFLNLLFFILIIEQNTTNIKISNKVLNSNITENEYNIMNLYINNLKNGLMIHKDQTYLNYKNPRISVVIALYNGENFIKTTLLSIYNQNFKEIEIIFINDCSTDNIILPINISFIKIIYVLIEELEKYKSK